MDIDLQPALLRDYIDCLIPSRAFTEYYEGPTEFSAGALEGFGVLKSTWERAYANGKFEEADVGQLTDW